MAFQQLNLHSKFGRTALTSFKQLTDPAIKRISIGEPRTVPAGQYATEVFKNLGILEQIKSKFVLGNNVRSVLTTVETGDVDAGIVYITDAKSSDKVKIAAIADEKLHSPIHYPIAVLKSSKSLAGARQYAEFLSSKAARAVFKNMGLGFPNLNRRLNVNPRSIAAVDFAKSIATSDDRYLWTRHDRRL